MRVNRLDLNRLVALDALLSEASVSRAAHRVHLSQPAMSGILAALREYFGDPLLVPAGRAMQVTPFARTLMSPVREVMLQAQAVTHRRPGNDVATLERTVTIIASEFTASLLLPQALRSASLQAPGLRFEIRPVADLVPEELDRGDVDVVIGPQQAMTANHPSTLLFETGHACLVWSAHRCVGAGLSASDYLAARHVVVHWAPGRFQMLDAQALASARLSREADVTVPSFTLIPQFLVGTDRIATVPRPLALQLAQHWPVEPVACPIDIPSVAWAMQWQRYQSGDPAIVWLRDRLLASAQEHGLFDA